MSESRGQGALVPPKGTALALLGAGHDPPVEDCGAEGARHAELAAAERRVVRRTGRAGRLVRCSEVRRGPPRRRHVEVGRGGGGRLTHGEHLVRVRVRVGVGVGVGG
eukprot:scaffold26379_cov58-Phaeocystis_antarctica.AAC.2